jgi:hypothetical protein
MEIVHIRMVVEINLDAVRKSLLLALKPGRVIQRDKISCQPMSDETGQDRDVEPVHEGSAQARQKKASKSAVREGFEPSVAFWATAL